MGTLITVLAASILSLGGIGSATTADGDAATTTAVAPLHWQCC